MNQDREIVFPPFRLDPANQRLNCSDRVISLRPKTFGVLLHLAQRAHQLVTKDELLDAVWSGVSVSDAVLKGCIREIRDALGDDAAAPRFIETAHRRGYRFIAPVLTAVRPLQQEPVAESRSAVGRETELAKMESWLSRSLRGERQLVFVTGEPGIGKTTLVDAFVERSGDPSISVGRGQCVEHHGVGEAYLPILEALGRLCRGPRGNRLVEIVRQYAPTWLAQLPALVDSADEAFRQQVLGTTPQRMLRELAEAIEVITTETPLVLVLEDLHWSDYSTLDLLASLARRRESARLFVVGTYRPEDVAPRGHPLANLALELQTHRLCEWLPLADLSEEAVAEYLRTRFSAHRFPTGLARVIHQRTDGNPLFMVSVLDDLVARGAIAAEGRAWVLKADLTEVALGTPENIRQMLEHRIEHLSSDEQRLLEAASVAGEAFSSLSVAAVLEHDVVRVEEWCDGLVRRHQVLSRSPSVELPGGIVAARYRFKHALYRNVVYGRIPAARRSQLHAGVGNAIEALCREHVDEIAAALAVHFEEGGDHEKAVTYLQQAAENAARRSANQEAATLARRGLQLLARLPETPERAHRMLGLQMTLGSAVIATNGYSAPEVEQVFSAARDQCRLLGETPALFRALWGLGRFYLVRTPLETAREFGEGMLQFAERAQDCDFLLQAHNALGAPLFHLGEFEQALTHFEQGIALYEPERHRSHAYLYVQDPKVVCLARGSLTLWCLGRPNQALEWARQAITWARYLSHPFSEAFALNFGATLHEFRQEWQAAETQAAAAIALTTQQGFSLFSIMGTLVRGGALSELEEGDAGRSMIAESANASETAGAQLFRSYGLGMLARAYGKAGRLDEACAVVTEALALPERTGERFYEAELHRLHGEFLLRTGAPEHDSRAEACFHRAIDVATAQRALSLKLRAVVSLARLYQKRGRREEADRIVAEIYGSFTEGWETADLQEAAGLLHASPTLRE
jgi:predicted ATPase/DNA-binding winged helix-turn-helix (wHTH) protein